MREILFRGKRVDNGEWVQGVPCGGYMILGFDTVYGDDEVAMSYYLEFDYVEINPSTFGECTGLTDKNGVKIFEGDIVKEYKTKDKVKGVVKFGEYQSGINKYADDLGFYVEWTTENFLIRELGYWCRKNMLEVIGNIHDNPELLEEKK